MQLANYLSEQKLSARDFAALIKVSEASVSRYLNGKRVPEWRVLKRIQEATGGQVTPNDFAEPEAA